MRDRGRFPSLTALRRALLLGLALCAGPQTVRAGGSSLEWIVPLGSSSASDVLVERCNVQRRFVFGGARTHALVLQPCFVLPAGGAAILVPVDRAPTVTIEDERFFVHLAAAIDPPAVLVHGAGASEDLRPTLEAVAEETPPCAEVEELVVLESEGVLDDWLLHHSVAATTLLESSLRATLRRGGAVVAGIVAGTPEGPRRVRLRPLALRARGSLHELPLAPSGPDPTRELWFLLGDEPLGIAEWDEAGLVRQVSGARLVRHFTEPLPLRLLEGRPPVPGDRRLARLRDPAGQTQSAWRRLAADLIADRYEEIQDPLGVRTRGLRRICEGLGLVGAAAEALLESAAPEAQSAIARDVHEELLRTTLSVLDSAFLPERSSAPERLRLVPRRIDPRRNLDGVYDVAWRGRPPPRAGTLYTGPLDALVERRPEVPEASHGFLPSTLWIVGIAAAYVGVVAFLVRRRSARLLVVCLLPWPGDDGGALEEALRRCVREEGDAAALAAVLATAGSPEVLADRVQKEQDLLLRGYALLALDTEPSRATTSAVRALLDSPLDSSLVRVWCAALLLRRATPADTLEEPIGWLRIDPVLAPLFGTFLGRWSAEHGPLRGAPLDALLDWSDARDDETRKAALGAACLVAPRSALLEALLHSDRSGTRRAAARALEDRALSGETAEIAEALVQAARFDPAQHQLPWRGVLHLPRLAWNVEQARRFGTELLHWYAERSDAEDAASCRELDRILRSEPLQSALSLGPEARHARGLDEWRRCWTERFGELAGVPPER